MHYTSIREPNCHKETDLKQRMTLWTGNLRLKTLNHNLIDMETKICKKCGKELPVDKFYKNKSQKDGLGHYCKDCVNAYKSSKKANADGGGKLTKVFTNPDLAKFKPRELIEELKARGYEGTLTYEQVITL